MTKEEFREKYGSLNTRSHADEAIEIVMIRHNLSLLETVRIAFEREPKDTREFFILQHVIAETERIEREALR